MSILLSTLVTRLIEDVPDVDGVPSTTQYENAVKDAVRDFSEKCGLEQIGTLNIVSGTAVYALAADFVKLISLDSMWSAEGVLIAPQGIIPVGVGWEERTTIRNGQITFYPTPAYTLARPYRYKAAWVGTLLTDSGYGEDYEYETMGENEARIVLLKAQSIALVKQGNAQDGSAIKYSFGAVSEDLSGASVSSLKNAVTVEDEYLAACNEYNGTYAAYGD
jgi:peptidoglycan hydrolase-like protein with peptidoglycan-binding domain